MEGKGLRKIGTNNWLADMAGKPDKTMVDPWRGKR